MFSAPFGLYYVFHWESVTTDIKSRLSGVGKQWKEKLTAKMTAEEAKGASPADTAAVEEQEPLAAATETAAEDALNALAKPASEKPGDTEPAQETGGAGGSGEEPPEPSEETTGGRITDEALAEVLLAFGWQVPEDAAKPGMKPPAGATLSAPALEELAAEVTAAMEGFDGEDVSVYEEEPTLKRAEAEKAPSQAVSEATHVFPVIGTASAEGPVTDHLLEPSGTKPAEETAPEKTQEKQPEEERPMDAKELFSGMNQEILKEVFSEEELQELEGDATHVFKKEEMEDLSEKQKQAEEIKPQREAAERRRAKREKAESKAAEDRSAKKRLAAPPAEPVFTARDYRPIRRKRSYHTGLRGGLMYFGFVICVSVILASVGWLAADDVLSLNKDYVEAEVYVGEELDMKQVSAELYNKGLIKYPRLFRLFAKLMNAETKMDPGVYKLSTKLDYNAMVHAMHQSESNIEERATVTVMIPEGKTLKQTFQIRADHGVCPYETLLECAANHEFKYDFLEDLPYGSDTRLEGYLFPDTYQFYAPSDPEDAIDKFLSNFNSKVNMEMRLQAGEMGYSLHEIITVASLVEMEAGKDAERPTIASVIYNRLNSSYYPYLQIDATIQYALEERKESLTNADLEIDSPYNTYKYTGLPPGPIANPGLASIRAALAPESTGYYFYALNKSGSHNFFATMDQFNYFVNSSEFGG